MALKIRYGRFESAMRFQFKHAAATRKSTENVIVCLTGADGVSGYGEGCPREYVTGETEDSVQAFLQEYGPQFVQQVCNLEDIRAWMVVNAEIIDQNPAAFCAMEMAAIDLMSRSDLVSAEKYLGYSDPHQDMRFTAVLGDSSTFKTRLMVTAYRAYGFVDFKVKLSGHLQRDQQRLAVLPANARIRVDANNVWQDASQVVDYVRQLSRVIWAIEEPVHPFNYSALAEIAKALKIAVILDESIYLQCHVANAKQHLDYAIANIRVSKCGGILRSVDLANQCIAAGYNVILGAQVGETSLLTRAAIVVGNGLTKVPLAREGAYGRILLHRDICTRDLKFGKGGTMSFDNKILLQSGFGLDVESDRIDWPR